jgi:hypothetical protein
MPALLLPAVLLVDAEYGLEGLVQDLEDLPNVIEEVLNVTALHLPDMLHHVRAHVNLPSELLHEETEELGVIEHVSCLLEFLLRVRGGRRHGIFFSIVGFELEKELITLVKLVHRKLETHDLLTDSLQVVRIVKDHYGVLDLQG